MEARDVLEPGRVYLIEFKPGAELMDYKLLVFELKDLISRLET